MSSTLLLAVAREDADVLRNPVPSSVMEDFSDFAQIFVLHVHVPDPSLAGRVRHRLFAQIQKRFKEAGIEIPLPAQELFVKSLGDPQSGPVRHPPLRLRPPFQPAALVAKRARAPNTGPGRGLPPGSRRVNGHSRDPSEGPGGGIMHSREKSEIPCNPLLPC